MGEKILLHGSSGVVIGEITPKADGDFVITWLPPFPGVAGSPQHVVLPDYVFWAMVSAVGTKQAARIAELEDQAFNPSYWDDPF